MIKTNNASAPACAPHRSSRRRSSPLLPDHDVLLPLRREDGVLARHPPAQRPLQLRAQGEPAQLLLLVLADVEALALQPDVLHALEVGLHAGDRLLLDGADRLGPGGRDVRGALELDAVVRLELAEVEGVLRVGLGDGEAGGGDGWGERRGNGVGGEAG